MSRKWLRNNLGLIILTVIAVVFLYAVITPPSSSVKTISVSEMIADIKAGSTTEVIIDGTTVKATLKEGSQAVQTNVTSTTDFMTLLSGQQVDLGKAGVTVKNNQVSTVIMDLLTAFLPSVLIIGFFLFMMRQASGGGGQGGAFSFGRSKAKLFQEEGAEEGKDGAPKKKVTTFDDVAALEEAKEELKEIVEFLKNPKKFTSLGARIPKGVLLVGPPGTGKTLLARAVAGEARVPFFSISGSEFVEMFVGVGASRVRDLFETAKKSSPCIVFVDELDAVGRHRGAGLGGGHDEREQTLNQILVEMDGFDNNTNVIVMAATNRPDVLDPALLRPGRFDRQVLVDRADMRGREAILRIHARGKPMGPDVNLEVVAKQTSGFSGADLENVMNEAAILTARRNKKEVGKSEIEEAIDRVLAGPERKSKLVTERQKKLTAYHESGHALVARMLPHADPVHKISIIARGMAGGYTRFLPEEDRGNWTKLQFLDLIAAVLAGHATESVVFEDVSTGASDDLKRATSLARKMVTEFGMSDKLGAQTYGSDHQEVFLGKDLMTQRDYSEEVAKEIDVEVRKIMKDCYNKALAIIHQERKRLDTIAVALLDKEILDGKQFEEFFADIPKKKEEAKLPPVKDTVQTDPADPVKTASA